MATLWSSYTILSYGVKSPQKVLYTYYSVVDPCRNSWIWQKWRRWRMKHWSSQNFQSWVSMRLGWQCSSFWPMMEILSPQKICQQFQIKDKRCIMQIGDIVAFPAASGGHKEPQSMCSLRPKHQSNQAEAVTAIFIQVFNRGGVTTQYQWKDR